MSQTVTMDSDIHNSKVIEDETAAVAATDEVVVTINTMEEMSSVEEIAESNSPEICSQDIREIARSLISSFSSIITVDCMDAETSTVSIDAKTIGTSMTPTISPVRKCVSSSIRPETKDATTETEGEFTGATPISVPLEATTSTTVTSTLIPDPNIQIGNEENVSPWNSRVAEMFRLSQINGPRGDQSLPNRHEELDILRIAKKRASQERLVPQGKKLIKTKPEFRKQDTTSSAGTSILSRRPLSIRLYDLDYMGEPPILEDEKFGDDSENAATVPDVTPFPSNPHLRLGLSRRARPRKPLHENFANEQL